MTAATVDERLAWEARFKPRAALAAILGGILTLAGGVYSGVSRSDVPTPQFLDALRNVQQEGRIGGMDSLRVEQLRYFEDHSIDLVIAATLLGLGALLASGALTFLAYATRHRAERFPRIALYVPFIGGVLVFLGSVLSGLATTSFIGDLLAGDLTVDGINDAERPTSLIAASLIQGIGSLILAIAYVLVALNAMRAGLLTRFMGVLGIFAGLLVILPIVAVAPILQPFWLISLGVLFTGRWPNGVPPAWRTGRAEAWPTAAEQREAKLAEREAKQAGRPPRGGRGRAAAEVEDAPEAVHEPKLHPSSKKRKRKRRG